jgi:hypothetical protein
LIAGAAINTWLNPAPAANAQPRTRTVSARKRSEQTARRGTSDARPSFRELARQGSTS